MIQLNSPPMKDPGIDVFANNIFRLEHLCDHVLTSPESLIWFLLLDYYGRLDPRQEEAVLKYAMQLWGKGPYPPTAQGLYDGYSGELENAVQEARERGWAWQGEERDGGRLWRGLNRQGIYVMWDDNVLRTGMVALFVAKPPKTRLIPEERAKNPLPRRGNWKWPDGWKRPNGTLVPDLANLTERVKLQWFLECFRYGVRKLRGDHDAARLSDRLLHPLPDLDELEDDVSFEKWKAMRV